MAISIAQFTKAEAETLEVGIWDCSFFVTDKVTGEVVRNDDGTIALFSADNLDYSQFTEHLTADNLALRRSGGSYD